MLDATGGTAGSGVMLEPDRTTRSSSLASRTDGQNAIRFLVLRGIVWVV
jgi:hypothetical protein